MVTLSRSFSLAWLLLSIGCAKHQPIEISESGQGLFRKVGHHEVTVEHRRMPRLLGNRKPATCEVRLFVGKTGKPLVARIIQGEECPYASEQAAVKAAMGWRFAPLMEQGEPIQFQFRLRFVVRDVSKSRPTSREVSG
jgi:hypothetical protein